MNARSLIRSVLVLCAATTVLAACADAGLPRPDRRPERTGAPPGIPVPKSASVARSCEWQRLEAEVEQPLRALAAEGFSAKQALASLDHDTLKPHDWTLTRYLVRVLRELQPRSLKEATINIGNENYAQASLRDAVWDGVNAWSVVEDVRVQTMEILLWLETVRTTDNAHADEARSISETLLNAARTFTPSQANARC